MSSANPTSGRPRQGDQNGQAPATKLPRARYIRDQQAWDHCLQQLRLEPRLAIDLEANSMFAYRERVCLIQISTPAADYIIDPLAIPDLGGLGELMADPAIEKVFHAVEYDLLLMTRDYGWELNNLFDTMWAARILGFAKLGLASLLEQFFGLSLSKRFQKSDWCRRPLDEAQLAYAQTDTHYLLELRDVLEEQLISAGKQAQAVEIFREQTHARPVEVGFDPEGYWNLQGVYDLSPQQRSVLRALYAFRDQEAQRRDVPLFKVISDRSLMALAEAMPSTRHALLALDGVIGSRNQRLQQQLLDLIATARTEEPPRRPKKAARPPDSVLSRYDALHTWRKETAREQGVESDVISSRDALWAIAQANPRSRADMAALDVLGPWRFKTYADAILQVLNKAR